MKSAADSLGSLGSLDAAAILSRIRARIADLQGEIEDLETAARVIEEVVEAAGKVAVVGRIVESTNGRTNVFSCAGPAAAAAKHLAALPKSIAPPTNKTAREVIEDEIRRQAVYAKGNWSGEENGEETNPNGDGCEHGDGAATMPASAVGLAAAEPPCPAQGKTPALAPARFSPRYRWQRVEIALRAIGRPSRPIDIAREMQRRGMEDEVSVTRLASWLSVTMQCKDEIFRRAGKCRWALTEWGNGDDEF